MHLLLSPTKYGGTILSQDVLLQVSKPTNFMLTELILKVLISFHITEFKDTKLIKIYFQSYCDIKYPSYTKLSESEPKETPAL